MSPANISESRVWNSALAQFLVDGKRGPLERLLAIPQNAQLVQRPDQRRIYRITNSSVQRLIPMELTKLVNTYNQKCNAQVMDKYDFLHIQDNKPQPFTTVESGLPGDISWIEVGLQKQGKAFLAAILEFGMFPQEEPTALTKIQGN